PGELVTTNNELSTFVNVLKGGLNVLYVEGTLRVEEKFLRRALGSSPDIKVDYVRLDPRDPQSRPGEFADRFKPGKYDVYILGDVDSTAFAGDELARLADCVNRGAGLIMLGGFQSFGPGGYENTPLNKVLPVGMDRLERQQPGEPVRSDLHWPGPLHIQPTPLGLRHFALLLAGNRQENEAIWSKLPPLEGANRLHDLAAGAVVLADAGPDKPLLVAHSFGDGRVMAFAADSTWRWWMRGYESAYKRFWRQIVLWLARKDQAQEGSVWVRLNQRRFAPLDRVEFAAGANSPTGEPITDAAYKAEVVLPDGSRRPLALVRQDQQMLGSFRDTQTSGDYAIEVTATQKDQPLGVAKARFLVFRQDLELDNASADAGMLDSLAAMTGGQSIAPEKLPDLIRKLTENTKHLEVQQETKKSFWDTWLFFLTLVALLSLEWYLRKRWGLV
ncbi:MAG: glutamine amidotransferase, partial [Phycisphaerales bacterium]